MTRMRFFFWYYTRGLVGMASLVPDAALFALHFFNVVELLRTLFSPWHRDVTHKGWRGLHPLLSLQALFYNLFARFMGFVVRTVVIGCGILAALLLPAFSGVLLIGYAIAPILIIVSFPLFFFSPLLGAICFACSFALVLVVALMYMRRAQFAFGTEGALLTAPWLARALERVGIEQSVVPTAAYASESALLAALAEHAVAEKEWRVAVDLEATFFRERQLTSQFWKWEQVRESQPIGKFWAFGYTPTLDRFCVDLSATDYSDYRSAPWVGREQVWELLLLALTRPNQNNILLVGEPGVGKRTLIHALARALRTNQLSSARLGSARVLVFDLGEAISEASNQGRDFKESVRSLLAQAVMAGNIILVIENIERFLLPGSALNCADIFHDYLALPTCCIIGTLTPANQHALAEHQVAAIKYFETLLVPEPTQAETVLILARHFQQLERRHIVFTVSGLGFIVSAAERYNWDTPFPERAIDLAQEVFLFWEKHPTRPKIDRSVVEAFLSLKSGVPLGEVTETERVKLLDLEARLHERIIGQEDAVRQLSEAFRKARSGLGNAQRPVGSFLFLGPTGVGKTETAKALAAVYFGSEEHMVRLDMSEFQGAQAVEELIGSEALAQDGRLTTLVKEHPFSILLLDEIEKANPRVLDLFLQILDEGFVTDGFGHKVNFRNLIIIATSNAGAQRIREAASSGTPLATLERSLVDHIVEQGIFRPELLNRFDGIVLFNTLTVAEIQTVTEHKLAAFAERVHAEKNITLTFAPDAVAAIVEHGYAPEFGVRSINRYIADVVEDAIVKRILEGKLVEGASCVFTASDISV